MGTRCRMQITSTVKIDEIPYEPSPYSEMKRNARIPVQITSAPQKTATKNSTIDRIKEL
jgi:hypothetical protein